MEIPQRVLLIVTQEIGDVLLATPLLRTMRSAWPDTPVDVLVYAGKGGMLEGNADCHRVLEAPLRPTWKSSLTLIKTIFRRYDLAIITQGSDRAHMYGWFAAPVRVGMIANLKFSSRWKRFSCGKWSLLDNVNTHTVDQNLKLTDLLGLPRVPIVCPPAAAFSVDVINIRSKPYAVLHISPRWPYKAWPEESWITLIKGIFVRGMHVFLTGVGSAEYIIGERHERRFPAQVTNLINRLSLGELTTLLQDAEIFVGPDTSVTHQAAASGTPTVALYGPSNPVKWGPWPFYSNGEPVPIRPYEMVKRPWQEVGNVILIQGSGSCVPCREEGCDRHQLSRSQCMEDLSPQLVLSAADKLLDGKSGHG